MFGTPGRRSTPPASPQNATGAAGARRGERKEFCIFLPLWERMCRLSPSVVAAAARSILRLRGKNFCRISPLNWGPSTFEFACVRNCSLNF